MVRYGNYGQRERPAATMRRITTTSSIHRSAFIWVSFLASVGRASMHGHTVAISQLRSSPLEWFFFENWAAYFLRAFLGVARLEAFFFALVLSVSPSSSTDRRLTSHALPLGRQPSSRPPDVREASPSTFWSSSLRMYCSEQPARSAAFATEIQSSSTGAMAIIGGIVAIPQLGSTGSTVKNGQVTCPQLVQTTYHCLAYSKLCTLLHANISSGWGVG